MEEDSDEDDADFVQRPDPLSRAQEQQENDIDGKTVSCSKDESVSDESNIEGSRRLWRKKTEESGNRLPAECHR